MLVCLAMASGVGGFGTVCRAAAPAPAATAAAAEQMRLAEGLISRNFQDLARQELERFLTQYPADPLAPRAALLLIESLRHDNKFDEALQRIEQFKGSWPDSQNLATLLLLKGEILLGRRDSAAAQKCFEELATAPATATREAALYYLGHVAAQKGDTAQALAILDKLGREPVTAESPFRASARSAAAALRQQQGDFAGAETGYRGVADEKAAPRALREEACYRLAELIVLRNAFADAVKAYDTLLVEFPDGAWSKDGRRRRAWALFQARDYARAAEQAQDWIRRYGDAGAEEMLYLCAASLAGAGRHPEAVAQFRALLTRPALPESLRKPTRVQLVYALLLLGKPDEVVAESDAFLRDYAKAPETADLRYFKGEAAFQKGDCAGAVGELRQAIDASVGAWPFLETASARLVECLRKLNRVKEAAAVYRFLAGRAGVPNRADLLLRAAELERSAGDLDAAIQDLTKLRETCAAAVAEFRTGSLRLAGIFAEQGATDRAAAVVADLQKRDTGADRTRLQVFSGYLLFLERKLPQAEQALRAAAQAPGGDTAATAEAKFYLAVVLLEMNRVAEGLVLFAEVLKLPDDRRPAFSDALLLRLERLFFVYGQLDASETLCRRLVASANVAVADRARLHLVSLLLARNQRAEARRTAEELLKAVEGRNPDGGAGDGLREDVLSVLGEICWIEGQNDQAVSLFTECLKKPAGPPEAMVRARWGMAEVMYAEKQPAQALKQAVSAFILGDDPVYSPRAMLLAVRILQEQGRTAEALTTWKELAARFPAFAEARKGEPWAAGLQSPPAPPAMVPTTP